MLPLLAVMLGSVASTSAQENPETSHCQPNELDMGDYCISLPSPANPEESALRRVTPFRARSMMPGLAGKPDGQTKPAQGERKGLLSGPGQTTRRAPAPEPLPVKQQPVGPGTDPSPPVVEHLQTAPAMPAARPSGNFGVQLGVFSSKSTAISVGRPLADAGLPVYLTPVERGGRVLWACIHGPYPDQESAADAAGRLRIDHRVGNTYIKPLADLELTELSHDTTEK
jgi:cell division septation protein DedD